MDEVPDLYPNPSPPVPQYVLVHIDASYCLPVRPLHHLWGTKISSVLFDSAVTESVATDIRSDDEDDGEDDNEKEE